MFFRGPSAFASALLPSAPLAPHVVRHQSVPSSGLSHPAIHSPLPTNPLQSHKTQTPVYMLAPILYMYRTFQVCKSGIISAPCVDFTTSVPGFLLVQPLCVCNLSRSPYADLAPRMLTVRRRHLAWVGRPCLAGFGRRLLERNGPQLLQLSQRVHRERLQSTAPPQAGQMPTQQRSSSFNALLSYICNVGRDK
jgi:hypothetical protein